MTTIDRDRYDALTFDCYGTLIDWETGLVRYLEPMLAAHDAHAGPSFLLDFFGRTEAKLQSGPYRPYRKVLEAVLQALGERLGLHPSAEALANFPESIGDWQPFADTVPALKALGTRFRLAIVSNVDDDLFELTRPKLGVAFDHVVTAGQVKAYKPDQRVFTTAFERIGVDRKRILHVAQSRYHDIVPATALGLDTVWIDRHAGHGGGATIGADATPTWTLQSLAELAAAFA